MFKKLIAGVLLASVALSAIAPVASANAEGKGQVKSNKDFVSTDRRLQRQQQRPP